MSIKESDLLFLEYFFESGDITIAANASGITNTQAKKIIARNKEVVLENVTSELSLLGIKAVRALGDGLEAEAGETQVHITRIKAAEGVLDRVGAAKKQALEITAEITKPIYYAPSKD